MHRSHALRAASAALVAALWLTVGSGCGDAPSSDTPLHGIVLLGIDTLRADGLSCYGNPRKTSPHIDALAARGHLFESAISSASWTLPGFIAILSGEFPSASVFDGRLLRSGVEGLRTAGYRTAAFTESGYVSAHLGMDRGFDSFWEQQAPRVDPPSADDGIAKTFRMAREWLRENADEPFFLFVHTYEPHLPYQRLELTEGLDPGALGGPYEFTQGRKIRDGEIVVGEAERTWVRGLYDGGVLATDREVGGLLALLDELGVADRTLVVLTSDHGEQLGEHAAWQLGLHSQSLWDTIVHVPLLVYDPRREDGGQRIASQARVVDVMPTILALAGAHPSSVLDGRSLVPMMDGRETEDRPAYSEVREKKTGVLMAASWRQGGKKLHVNLPAAHELAIRGMYDDRAPVELFDVARDPAERRDLASQEVEERDRLRSALDERIAEMERRGNPWAAERDLTPEARERLEALGYVNP